MITRTDMAELGSLFGSWRGAASSGAWGRGFLQVKPKKKKKPAQRNVFKSIAAQARARKRALALIGKRKAPSKKKKKAALFRPVTPLAIVAGAGRVTPFERAAGAGGVFDAERVDEVPTLEPSETLHAVEEETAPAARRRTGEPQEEPEETQGEEEPEAEEQTEESEADAELEGLGGDWMSARDVTVLGSLGFSSDDAPPPYNPREIVPVVGPAEMIPEPPKPPKGSGWPLAAKPTPEAWARGDGSYIVQRGDSMSGISRTYLGAYERWREIWAIQTREFLGRHPSPDRIQVGDVVLMPLEAQKNARKLGVLRGLSPGGKKGLIVGGVLLGVVTIGGVGYGLYSGALGG